MTTYTLRFLNAWLPILCLAATLQAAEAPFSSPEQKVLDRFIGTWRTEYKVLKAEWTPIETTGSADVTFSRTLEGRFVQEQGKHSDNTTSLLMYTYDLEQESYRMWWFSSTGNTAESTGEWAADKMTFTWTSVSKAGQGFTVTTRHLFPEDNVFEWDTVIKDQAGKILFRKEGKAILVKDSNK